MNKREIIESILPYDFRFMQSDELDKLKQTLKVCNTCLLQPTQEEKKEEHEEKKEEHKEKKEDGGE